MKSFHKCLCRFAASLAVSFVAAAFLASPSLADKQADTEQAGGLWHKAIYISGRDGYHTYRVPSIIVTTKGTVLAFCEGRKHSSNDSRDIDLLVKRSTDGGRTFSRQQIVCDDGANTCGNPCGVVDRTTGTVWMLMSHNLGTDNVKTIINETSQSTRAVWVTKSIDDGRTWSKTVDITSTAKNPNWTWHATGPGNGIQLECGRLVIPCNHYMKGKDKRGYSHIVYSDDHGKTWLTGGTAGPRTDECTVAELSDGQLLLNMRNYNRSVRARVTATSSDRGDTWSKVMHEPTLIEPVCHASLQSYEINGKNGCKRDLLFSNPAQEIGREKMTVRLSRDDGKTWPVAKLLYAGPSAYSCLAVLPDGDILCFYERGEKTAYETITLARFGLKWLTNDK